MQTRIMPLVESQFVPTAARGLSSPRRTVSRRDQLERATLPHKLVTSGIGKKAMKFHPVSRNLAHTNVTLNPRALVLAQGAGTLDALQELDKLWQTNQLQISTNLVHALKG